jgi:O-antigen ligase
MLDFVASPMNLRVIGSFGAGALLVAALWAPETTLLAMPLSVLLLAVLLFYEFPLLLAGMLVLVYGAAMDVQVDNLTAVAGTGAAGAMGAALIKLVPFALAAVLLLRYGVASAINWPFLAFAGIAAISIAVLPMGRVVGNAEMIRSFIGSTAPFVLGFALAPKSLWTALCRGAAFVPVISTVVGLLAGLVGFYAPIDTFGRFQGLHSPPFLAGFCSTAIFACVLEYLRGFRLPWLLLGGVNLAILLATQARAPLAATILFLGIVFLLSNRHTFPLKRKVDLVMGGMLPALVVLGPITAYAIQRFTQPNYSGGDFNFSGRDIIWPFFVNAIEQRPLFGFGLGAGKLIVDPLDPGIRYLGSNAAHNEYLRLSVDGGIIGCAAIFISLVAWVVIGTRRAPLVDRLVLRAAIAAVLLHSGFDNTLIASTAVIQFTWFGAALARCRLETREAAATQQATRAEARRLALAAG